MNNGLAATGAYACTGVRVPLRKRNQPCLLVFVLHRVPPFILVTVTLSISVTVTFSKPSSGWRRRSGKGTTVDAVLARPLAAYICRNSFAWAKTSSDVCSHTASKAATRRAEELVIAKRPAFPCRTRQGEAAQDAEHPVGHPRDASAARFPVLDRARGHVQFLGSLGTCQAGLLAQIGEVMRVNPLRRLTSASR